MLYSIWTREDRQGGVELGLSGKERIQHGDLREMKEAVDEGLRLRCGMEGEDLEYGWNLWG